MGGLLLRPHHCGLSVGDLDEAVEWFDRVLGFALEREDEFLRSKGIRVAFLTNGDFCIELFQHEDSLPGPTEGLHPDEDIRTRGTKHICFTVSDMDELLARCRAHGVPLAMEPKTVPGKCVVVFIHGPDGILIEFVQPIDSAQPPGSTGATGST